MINSISERGVELIKSCEGFSPFVYNCAGGKKTIGYGHVLLPNKPYEVISEDIAESILKKDILIFEDAVRRNIKVSLMQNQFDALVSLVFNIGAAAFQRSTLRQKINYSADIGEITREFMRWIYSGGRILAGLTKRRMLEVQLFLEN